MQKTIVTLLLCCGFIFSFAQKQRKVSTYLSTQFNTTLYDVVKANNPWAVGLGLQAFLNTATKFKPTIEFTGDLYLENDKVARFDANGNNINSLEGMVNLFVGTSFNPTQRFYISVVGGPSFVGGQTKPGIKPTVGLYFPKSQRWVAKISYINIFNRDNTTKEDFGSLSFAIGLKLF